MAETKRKHVVFAQDTTIHPSRRRAVDGVVETGSSSSQPKVKTAAKQRYLKKEAKRRKIRVAARKASAPKSKPASDYQVDGETGRGMDDGAAAQGRTAAIEVPSIARPGQTDSGHQGAEPPSVTTDFSEKERRKMEKRLKRANRRKEEPPIPGAVDVLPVAADAMETQLPQHPRRSTSPSPDPAMPEAGPSRSPSPSMLQRFPLPTSAPAPHPSVLSRQGLPAGLQDATFIDQGATQSIDTFRRKGGQELSKGVRKRLDNMGIKEFFAVQSAMLPPLLDEELDPEDIPNDYLVSAPTGSGKTLAYCIPLVEILSSRQVIRLRALIVLPTRELVNQVRDVLESLAKGTGLRISAITGQQSFTHEQAQLVPDMKQRLIGGSSSIDILIATPGRLMDHLSGTPNFSLQHLRFLIIDEADRLLNQSFQSWLSSVSAHIYPPSQPIKLDQPPEPWDHIAPAWMETFGLTDLNDPLRERYHSPCQKLLFSATLTRDPSKIAALSLRKPKYYIIQSPTATAGITSIGEQFAVPEGLTEKMIVLPPALKPLNLIHLLYAFSVRNALIFTKSVEAALRLETLLSFFQDAWTGEKLVARAYTAEMKPGERRQALESYASGVINLLICSDLVARGVDLPSTSHVVSYDVPMDMRKYIHRVGRTARAGRTGTAWTLVEKQEARRFKTTLKSAGHDTHVKKVKVREEDLEPYQESYKIAMRRFAEMFSRS